MVAICKYIPRNYSLPIFVALVPQVLKLILLLLLLIFDTLQEEELDEGNIQISPPGFNVIFLPFSEDMRSLTFPEDMPKGKT